MVLSEAPPQYPCYVRDNTAEETDDSESTKTDRSHTNTRRVRWRNWLYAQCVQ